MSFGKDFLQLLSQGTDKIPEKPQTNWPRRNPSEAQHVAAQQGSLNVTRPATSRHFTNRVQNLGYHFHLSIID